MRWRARECAGRCVLVACAVVAGCAGGAVRGGGASEPVRTGPAVVKRGVAQASAGGLAGVSFDTVERIDAIAGQALVVPLENAVLREGSGPVRLLLDDGLDLAGEVYEVTISPSGVRLSTEGAHAWGRWLGATYAWRARKVSWDEARAAAREDRGGVGFALLVQPKAGRTDKAAWLGAQRVPMQWLQSVRAMSITRPELGDSPWRATAPEGWQQDAACAALIAREGASPLTRWRAKLLMEGLKPDVQGTAVGSGDGARSVVPVFDDPLLEALARQQEERWRVAFARLWSEDAALARRVQLRVSAIGMVGERTLVPAWETDQRSLDALLLDLLNVQFSAQRRAQLAETWLRDQPGALCWVVEDAARDGARGSTRGDAREGGTAIIGVCNLAAKSAPVWLSKAGAGALGEMSPVDAGRTQFFSSARGLMLGAGGAGSTMESLRVHAGEWSRELVLQPAMVGATPPGVVAQDFAPDQTLQEMLGGAMGSDVRAGSMDAQESARWATGAMVTRAHGVSAPGGLEASLAEARGWELYIEAKMPADVQESVRDASLEAIDIFTGDFGSPSAVWRVGLDGTVVSVRPQDALRAATLGAEVARAEVSRQSDRWTLRVPLPPGSVDGDGVVRLGLVRHDALGRRWSWPRALAPWQGEPARANIDLRAWWGVASAEEPARAR